MKLAKLLLLSLTAFSAILPLRAFADDTTLGYVINKLPYTITIPGVYHFVRDLTFVPAAGNAISVDVAEVTIDFNGFQLICSAGAANTACAVRGGQDHVRVQNGTIRGFANGIVLASAGGSVSNVYFTNIYRGALGLVGRNIEVINNRICNTGGSTVATGPVIGISTTGTYGEIANNEIEDTFGPDATGHGAIGIQVAGSSDLVISNNRVLDVEPSVPVSSASSVGIIATSSSNLVILGNVVTTSAGGIDLTGASNTKFGENTTTNVTNPYIGGSANGNVSIPGNN
jgi:parallel beta-helix repeat protein